MKRTMELKLAGWIDSTNAAAVEKDLLSQLDGQTSVVLDAQELKYISSAGLRVILRLRKDYPDLRIINVNSDIYEILDMTGFTDMMPVEKAYRVVSVEGCEEIGHGANGTIYRIDKDNVVKVYNNADALGDIRHEREMAKLALILGIPTAISYDVVRVGERYGSVFELLNARAFSEILAGEPERMDWCVAEYVKLLRQIHATAAPAGRLPDMWETVRGWAEFMRERLPGDSGDKLIALIEATPRVERLVHGDFHTKNLMLMGDEVLLIDMDTLSVGHPVFELASIYNALIGFSELDHSVVRRFQGFDFETARTFWRKALAAYLGTDGEAALRAVEDKARIVGYTRLLRRSLRRNLQGTPSGRAEFDHWTRELTELLERTDTLDFTPGDGGATLT